MYHRFRPVRARRSLEDEHSKRHGQSQPFPTSVPIQRPLLAVTMTLLLIGGVSDAQSMQSMNLERIQQTASLLVDSIFDLDGLPQSICLNVVAHPADWIIAQAITEAGSKRNRPVEPCSAPFLNEVLIAVLNVDVRYVELEDDDYYRREVDMALSISLPVAGTTGRLERQTRRLEIINADTIETVTASEREQMDYPMTVATRIERNHSSFWSRIAEPAIVIGTSVAMLVLLFTTRSQ